VLSKMAKQRRISSIFSRINREEQSASVAKDLLNIPLNCLVSIVISQILGT
jgi:hypothetical protein